LSFIRIESTRKKLFRDQYLATKWNGC